MSKFDTQIHIEDTSAYSDYVDAEELRLMMTMMLMAATEADEPGHYDYDDGHDEDNWTHTSYDDIEEILLQYDEERDIDFYSS